MVYTGKPSRACQTCRKRKIKCDEALPACTPCLKSDRICPGYIEAFDLVLRDQTESIREKVQRKKRTKPSTSSTSPPVDPTSTALVNSNYPNLEFALSYTVPQAFRESPEQAALCYFFSTYVLLPCNPDATRGYMGCIQPLYTTAKLGSVMSVATSALALSMLGNHPGRQAERLLSHLAFGKALLLANQAIQDPVQVKTDETLMAVLLLGMYERINSVAGQSVQSGQHNAGAVALIKHRGSENIKSDISRTLLLAVRTQLVDSSIQNSESLDNSSFDWPKILTNVPHNAAVGLILSTADIADLRAFEKEVFGKPGNRPLLEKVIELMERASQVDATLAEWPKSLPKSWKWKKGYGLDHLPDDVRASMVYEDRMDVYTDLWVANTWNSYRSSRILIQSIILNCIPWITTSSEAPSLADQSTFACLITQEMVDAICASIPFHLGTKVSGGPVVQKDTQYPHADGTEVSRDHRIAAPACGGYFLLSPMMAASKASCLREGQRKWLGEQMMRIGKMYRVPNPSNRASEKTLHF